MTKSLLDVGREGRLLVGVFGLGRQRTDIDLRLRSNSRVAVRGKLDRQLLTLALASMEGGMLEVFIGGRLDIPPSFSARMQSAAENTSMILSTMQ